MMPDPKPIARLRPVADAQTCFSCAASAETLTEALTEIGRLRAENSRLLAALQRESHTMDPREPYRRKG